VERRSAIFVLSDVRSGSTLLDQCLGAHQQIASLGEIHWLPAYVTQDRNQYNPVHELVCACSEPVAECPFWAAVREQLGRPLESLTLHSGFAPRMNAGAGLTRLKWLPRKIVRSIPALYKLGLVRRALGARRLAGDIGALLDAACAASGRPLCVDSSKSPFRFRAVYERDPSRNVAVVLVRDFRAVVHSKMKRGQSLENAARSWRSAMRQIEILTADLPGSRVHRLTYESLCAAPHEELSRLCVFLGIEFQEAMLRRPAARLHHIGGSPSKFDAAKIEITLDSSHEGAFTASQVTAMRRLVGDVADRWSY
jgi:hypothetical protein